MTRAPSRPLTTALYRLAFRAKALRGRVIGAVGGKTVGVRMLAEDADGRVCLIRHTYGDTAVWALPGGAVDWREDPEAAALRELREEAGIGRLWDVRLHGTYRHTLNWADDIVIVFAGRTDQPCHPASPEIAEAAFFATDALPEPLRPAARAAIAALAG